MVSYQKDLPLLGEYDVAVIGGGPAGVCAAIEAARGGARTLLAEAAGMLGGMATTALVGPFMTCYDRDGSVPVVGGLFREIVDRLVAAGGAIDPAKAENHSPFTSFIGKYHRHVTPFDSFALQMVLDDMTREAGVKVLLYTRFADCICTNGRIDTLVLHALEGLVAVKAKTVIDCSGNADVAACAGVPTWYGSETGDAPQPGTLFFEVDHADDAAFETSAARPERPVKVYRTPEKNTYKVNAYRVFGVNACSSESMTNAHVEGRRQVLQALDVLHRTPGFEHARLSQVASVFGTRESRHIEGRYRLTVQDLAQGTRFEDAILQFGYGMDIHSRDGKDHGNFTVEVAPVYQVPYRCLLPLGCDNLLVAGKTVSAESQAAGAIRVMPAAMGMGQAAGAAAALAVSAGIAPAAVPAETLRAVLLSHGALL